MGYSVFEFDFKNEAYFPFYPYWAMSPNYIKIENVNNIVIIYTMNLYLRHKLIHLMLNIFLKYYLCNGEFQNMHQL